MILVAVNILYIFIYVYYKSLKWGKEIRIIETNMEPYLHKEIVWLDVSVNEIFTVDKLNARNKLISQ